MESVLLNGSVLYICTSQKWDARQITQWIVKGLDINPNTLDEYLADLGIYRSNMSNFNYYPTK